MVALAQVAIQDFQIGGIPAVGGQLFVYAAGTTTKLTTYTDSTGATPQTNPIVLNARGEPENTFGASVGIWVPIGVAYKLVFTSATDTDPPTSPIWTVDNISAAGSGLAGTAAYATLTAAIAASIPAGITGVQTLGYATLGDGGEALYVPSSAGAGTGKFQSADGAWWELAVQPYSVKMFGAKGDGSTDDTTALSAALSWGGLMNVPRGTYLYSSLSTSVACRLIGETDSTGALTSTLQCTGASTADKITVSNVDGFWFQYLGFTSPSSTGGAIAFFNTCTQSGVSDCSFNTLNLTARGIKTYTVNTFIIDNVQVVEPTGAGLYAYGTDANRSDQINIYQFTVSGNSQGAATFLPAGVERDGFVNTITGSGWVFVQCGRGLYLHNSVGATARAQFITVHDLEVDYPYYECIRDEYGDSMFFSGAYLHGSITTYNVYIQNTTPDTSDNISFTGGQCTSAFLSGMYLNGRFIRVVGMEISANGQSGSNTYPGIEVGPNSEGIVVVGNHIGARTGEATETQNYGVLVDSGAIDYLVQGNDLRLNVTGPMLSTPPVANSSGVIMPNLGMTSPQSFTVQAPLTGATIALGKGVSQYDASTVNLNLAGTISTLTITLDAAPFDGQPLQVFSNNIVTTLTVTPEGGASINDPPTAMTAGGAFGIRYNLSDTTWYRTS